MNIDRLSLDGLRLTPSERVRLAQALSAALAEQLGAASPSGHRSRARSRDREAARSPTMDRVVADVTQAISSALVKRGYAPSEVERRRRPDARGGVRSGGAG